MERSDAMSLNALPEGCRVRVIGLPPGVNALLSMREDGGIDIFLNALLDEAARDQALRHELRHFDRGDLFSAADIREVEGDVPGALLAMGGAPMENPAPVFDAGELKAIGRGLYRPTGANLQKAVKDIMSLAEPMAAACRTYDILQRPPALPIQRLNAASAALFERPEAAIAFIAWQPGPRAALPVVLQFCTPEGDAEGAIYYAQSGLVDNALVTLCANWRDRDFRASADIRRRGGKLTLCALNREVDGRGWERMY